MRIAYRGNFQPDLPAEVTAWSTETHLAGSLEQLGHTVLRVQEDRDDWRATVEAAGDADLFLWTSTYGMAQKWNRAVAASAVEYLAARMPTAGVHLDLWWGLAREHQVREEPFFRLGTLFTADGDHDDRWAAAGIRHHWFPPAVYGPECVPGTPNPEWASDVAFIGSWEGYGHDEWWPHRKRLLDRLREVYGPRVAFWPRQGRGAVRSEYLNALLASVKVVVGDSCFADRSRRYFSDRAFEVVGRGGVLVHPYIDGLDELLPDGMAVRYFEHGGLDAMVEAVDWYLEHDAEREAQRAAGQAYVRDHHTYAHRMADVLDTLDREGAWP